MLERQMDKSQNPMSIAGHTDMYVETGDDYREEL
jgi:hypothetical protein